MKKTLKYILIFPFLLVCCLGYTQQPLVKFPKKVMEYTEGVPSFLPVPICPSYTLHFSTYGEGIKGEGTYTREEKDGKLSYQRFNFYYSNNEEKMTRGEPIPVSEEIDSTFYYSNDGSMTVFFNSISKYNIKIYRSSGITRTIPQKIDSQEKHYFINSKTYFGSAFNSKINPFEKNVTVTNKNDTLVMWSWERLRYRFLNKYYYQPNGLLREVQEFGAMEGNKPSLLSQFNYVYIWENKRLVSFKISSISSGQDYYGTTNYSFEYINDDLNDDYYKGSKIIVIAEYSSGIPMSLPTEYYDKFTINLDDHYILSFISERIYYEHPSKNHIISKGTFSCTCNN